MDQLQGKLYKLLVEIDDICKRNDIEYYLAGGTALGAIRGGGFLPWDDDIDLYITRKNWHKLVKVMEKETPENRDFVCVENDPYYRNVVGRYIDTQTTVMMRSQMVCGRACGQLIEFFIFDPMPQGEEAKWRHRQKVKTYCELLTTSFIVNRSIFYDNPEFDFDRYMNYRKRCKSEGEDKILKEILDEITSADEETTDSYCMCWGQRNLVYGKDMFGKPRDEKFEDRMFPVPAEQEKVARIAYGDDWMYIPDGQGKIVHNLSKDLETPFKEYVDIYMSYFDKDELYNAFAESKHARGDAIYDDEMFKREMAFARAGMNKIRIINSLPPVSELKQMLDNSGYDEIIDAFSLYNEVQSTASIKTQGILVDIGDEYLYFIFMANILSGFYYKISQPFKFRLETGRPLTPELEEVQKLFNYCRRLSVAVYDEMSPELTEKILEEGEEFKNILPDYARASLWLTEKRGDADLLLREADNWLKVWNSDGEVLRYRACALYRKGEKEQAAVDYVKAVKNTRNGYVWREAKDLLEIDAFDIVDNQYDEGGEH